MTELHHRPSDGVASAPRVLAVTSFRPEEIRRTASEMALPVEVISVDPTAGRLGHVTELYDRVSGAISEHDPDVILLDCFETMGVVVTLLAQRHEVPLVARLVGDIWRGNEQPALEDISSSGDLRRFLLHRASLVLDEFVLRRADGFVTVSNELKATACHRTGCPPEQVAVVPVPVTVDPQQEGKPDRSRRAIGVEQRRVVATVTNLKFPEKFEGVKTILAELQPVLESDSDLAYVIAGGGRFHEQLRSLVETEYPHLSEQIYVPGFVESVSDLLMLADVFVYVSYRDGYPNVVLEAQTAGLPVVANAAHGMVDQITDGETGYLVAPNIDGQLRSHVQRLLNAPDERERIGERARRRVRAENTPDAIAKELEDALQSILTEP